MGGPTIVETSPKSFSKDRPLSKVAAVRFFTLSTGRTSDEVGVWRIEVVASSEPSRLCRPESFKNVRPAFPIAAYTSGLIAIFPPFVVAS